jgi:hypothetical protein
MSNKALLDVGWSAYNNRWGGGAAPGNPTTNLIAVSEQGGSIPGLCYRSYSPACGDKSTGWISSNTWKAHFSYVTGAHNMKFGYDGLWNYDSQESNPAPPDAVQYRFNNGIPNQITEFSGMFESEWRTRFDALFIQDRWTLKRLTLQGGVRYDHAWSYYPSAQIGGTRLDRGFPRSEEIVGRTHPWTDVVKVHAIGSIDRRHLGEEPRPSWRNHSDVHRQVESQTSRST